MNSLLDWFQVITKPPFHQSPHSWWSFWSRSSKSHAVWQIYGCPGTLDVCFSFINHNHWWDSIFAENIVSGTPISCPYLVVEKWKHNSKTKNKEQTTRHTTNISTSHYPMQTSTSFWITTVPCSQSKIYRHSLSPGRGKYIIQWVHKLLPFGLVIIRNASEMQTISKRNSIQYQYNTRKLC